MTPKQLETAAANLAFGMLCVLTAVMIVSPIMGVGLGGCLRFALWLWGNEALSFGQTFVIGWGSTLTWMLLCYLGSLSDHSASIDS